MNSASQRLLEQYLRTLTESDRQRHVIVDAYHFCADEENANTCAWLVLEGEKRATAGLLWSYEDDDEPLPQVGQLTVVTDWDEAPQCIIETTSVEICPFEEVDAEFAYEEGEDDKSLAHWRAEHWKFFSQECEAIGKIPDARMPVILERFNVVWKADPAS